MLQDVFPGKYIVKLGGRLSTDTLFPARFSVLVEANGLLVGRGNLVERAGSSSGVEVPSTWTTWNLASLTVRGTAAQAVTIRIFETSKTLKQGLAIGTLSLERVFYHTRSPFNEL